MEHMYTNWCIKTYSIFLFWHLIYGTKVNPSNCDCIVKTIVKIVRNVMSICQPQVSKDFRHYLVLFRRACGFPNLVGTSVYGGHNLPPPPLVGIGLRWLPELGVDTSPRPYAHRRACSSEITASLFWNHKKYLKFSLLHKTILVME